jgi:hypothetical protein
VVGLTPISGGVYWQVTRAVDPGVLTMVFPEQIATDGSALRLLGAGVVDGLSPALSLPPSMPTTRKVCVRVRPLA